MPAVAGAASGGLATPRWWRRPSGRSAGCTSGLMQAGITWLAGLATLALLGAARPAAAQGWEPKPVAELQLLDKVTARVTVLPAKVGQPARFGTLTIDVRACNARPVGEVPDAAAWMEITDSLRGNAVVFRGWMFANAPGVSMLEHPVYDLRVLDCK